MLLLCLFLQMKMFRKKSLHHFCHCQPVFQITGQIPFPPPQKKTLSFFFYKVQKNIAGCIILSSFIMLLHLNLLVKMVEAEFP